MKEIFVARNELAATFTSSDVGRSARIQGVPNAITGSYTSLRISSARSFATPTTKRFGVKVSSTAKPSRRNSGFHAKSAWGAIFESSARRACAVPTGTVDLPTTREPSFRCGAIAATADFTYVRSAANPSLLCGVPTHTK